MLRPYLTFFYLLLGIGLALTLWFSGVHHGTVTATGTCNVERVATLTATNRELVRLKDLAERYAIQITDADVARDKAQSELARLARSPVPHLLCHAAPGGDGGPVPSAAGPAGPGAARARELPDDTEFDPSPALYAEARRADAIVEGCRDVLNRWPH